MTAPMEFLIADGHPDWQIVVEEVECLRVRKWRKPQPFTEYRVYIYRIWKSGGKPTFRRETVHPTRDEAVSWAVEWVKGEDAWTSAYESRDARIAAAAVAQQAEEE